MSSTIDWSKAPTGTTHFVYGSICPWEKRVGDQWYYWSYKNDWEPLSSPDCRGDARISASKLSIIARPTESPAWNGEGLPPVGTVCEVRSEGGWYVVRILAVDSDGFLVYESPWLNIPYDGEDDPHQFRPIRTPEQIAEEARSVEIDAMVTVWKRTMGRFALEERGLAEMLYDAGYRKVEQS